MGTTRIKVIDLSSDQQEIKTSRKRARLASLAKRAGKLAGSPRELGEAGAAKIKEEKAPKETKPAVAEKKPVTESTEKPAGTESNVPSVIKRSVPSVIHHRGRKYQQATKLVDKSRNYKLAEAIDILYKTSTTKFDPAVEVHLNVNDKNLKGTVAFPHVVAGKTKQTRYLIFSQTSPVPSLITNHIIWASEQTITDIEAGRLKPGRNFDAVIASPKFMPKLATIAKILGPAGVMPNPKDGTVTEDIASFFKKDQSAGQEYKTEQAAPIIHTKIGKLSAKPQELSDNLKALILAVGPAKIQKAVITSTMGPGIKVDLSSISK